MIAAALVALLAAPVASPSPSRPPFDLQGHRGARGLAPENTLAGFARALRVGVTTLELDLGVTGDGVVVVSHDLRLNPDITRGPDGRWLDGPGPALFTLDFAQLSRYDVGRIRPGSAYARRFAQQVPADGQTVPALSEVFALAGKAGNRAVRFNVETKLDPRTPELTLPPDAFADAVVAAVRQAGMEGRTTVQSFDWRTLRRVRATAPEIETVCLTVQQREEDNVQGGRAGAPVTLAGLDVDEFSGSVPRLVEASGCRTWSPNARDLTWEAVAEARRLGLKVVPWTVNDTEGMERVLAAGVHGLITDRPDLLRHVMAGRGLVLPEPTPVPEGAIRPGSPARAR